MCQPQAILNLKKNEECEKVAEEMPPETHDWWKKKHNYAIICNLCGLYFSFFHPIYVFLPYAQCSHYTIWIHSRSKLISIRN